MKAKTFLIAIPWLILLASAAWGLGVGGSGRVRTSTPYTFTATQTAPEWASSAADNTHYLNVNNSTSHKSNPSTGDIDTIAGLPWIYNGSWVRILLAGETTLPTQTGNSGKYLTTDGTTASWGTIAAGSGIAISAAIPTDAGAANLNDSTHVLTVASSTGYTQFTGSFTAWDTTPDAFSFTDETDIAISTAKTSNAITVAGINYPAAISVTGDTGYGYSKNSAACTATSGTVVAGDTVAACVTSSGSNSTATTATVTIGGVSDVYSVTTTAGDSPLLYWSASGSTVDSPNTITATISSPASIVSGGPNGSYLDIGGSYHLGSATIPITTTLLNKATSGRVKMSFYVTNNMPKRLFLTNGDQYSFTAYVNDGNILTFQMGDDSSRTTASVTSNVWHTAEFFWNADTMGMILDAGTAITHTINGSRGTGTNLILGSDNTTYGVDRIDEVYLYAN